MESVSGFKELMYSHPGPGSQWPNLWELIGSVKRIIFMYYQGEEKCADGDGVETGLCPDGFHDWFLYTGDTCKPGYHHKNVLEGFCGHCQGPLGVTGTIPSGTITSHVIWASGCRNYTHHHILQLLIHLRLS
jgi:hypothetical protein